MARLTLQARLQRVMRVGGVTPADLATWLGKGYQTVYTWIHFGREPRWGGDLQELHRRLDLLDIVLKEQKNCWGAKEVGARERQDYVQDLYHETNGRRLPKAHFTEPGVVLQLRRKLKKKRLL